MTRKIFFQLILIAALSVGACGTASEQGATVDGGAGNGSSGNVGDDTPVSSDPGSGDAPLGGGRPQRVRPQPGMADVRAIGWEKARQTASGRTLRVTYWSGVEPCNVLDRVQVTYDEKHVEVTLFEGHDPSAGDVACIEIAVQKVVTVKLQEALDGRKIVDGAK